VYETENSSLVNTHKVYKKNGAMSYMCYASAEQKIVLNVKKNIEGGGKVSLIAYRINRKLTNFT